MALRSRAETSNPTIGDNARRQFDEIEALKSIFPDEFQLDDSPQQVIWGRPLPPEFSINVQVRDVSGGFSAPLSTFSAVRLHVKYSTHYPDTAPSLRLSDATLLSRSELTRLQSTLEDVVGSFLGTEMIYDLITILQGELKRFAAAPAGPRSLIEERAQRLQAIVDKVSADDKQRQAEEENEQTVNAARIREQIEISRREQTSGNPTVHNVPQLSEAVCLPPREILFTSPITIDNTAIRALNLAVPCIENDRSRTRPWLSFVPKIGTFLIKEYCFEHETQDLLLELETSIDRIQKRLHGLIGIQNYARTVVVEDNQIKLYLAQEYVRQGSLRALLSTNDRIPLDQAKRWLTNLASEVVQAHRLGILHRNICAEKIMLKEKEGRIFASLCDWESSFIMHRQDLESKARTFTSNLPNMESRGRGPDDVVDLCSVFLEMLLGTKAVESALSIEEIWVSHSEECRPDLNRFLSRVIESSKRHKITPSDLLSMEFLRDVESSHGHLTRMPSSASYSASRYHVDFEELAKIGQGAYGVVVKARNRLDGRIYAVKKIRSDAESKVLREVSGLARLNHPSIVRYFGSWVETLPGSRKNVIDNLQGESSGSDSEEDYIVDDFMSTSGIVFQNSGCEESNAVSIGTECHAPRTLFIQMEYCSGNTLRVLIDKRQIGDLYWSCFAQIVDGVRYIHDQGLIHRDLKPANIFVSSDGQLKLGDFGLAMETVAQSAIVTTHFPASDENTGEIGTFLYQAPELLSKTPTYDAKIDLYSLGIILGEMICPWTTGMERVLILRQLRTPTISHSLDEGRFVREIDLLRALLDHDPSKRPSATELTQMIPPVVHRPRLQDTTKLLDQDRVFRMDVLSHFFADKSSLAEFVYDADQGEISDSSSLIAERVISDIRRIFRTHGGIDRTLWTPALLPLNAIYRNGEHIVKLLDQASNVLQLPFDFKIPFARQVARTSAKASKDRSFVIGPVFRSENGRAQSFLAADFDLAHFTGEAPEHFGVETLKILSEVARELPTTAGTLRVVLGHAEISKLILQQTRVPEQDHAKVMNILVALVRNVKMSSLAHWNKALASLLPQSAILQLIKFRPVPDMSFEDEVSRVLHMLDEDRQNRARDIMNLLLSFQDGARMYEIGLPILFHAFTPGSLIFDLAYTLESTKGPINVLAIGGSYSTLVQKLMLPGCAEKAPQIYGFSLAINKLVRMVEIEQEADHDFRRIDVIVHARAHETRATELISRLWSANISAELCFLEDALAVSRQRKARFLLTFKDKRMHLSSTQQIIKIRRVDFNDSEDVVFDSVTTHVLAELSAASRTSQRPAIPKLERALTARKEPEVIVISSDEGRKQKAAQRDLISSKALDCARNLNEQLNEASIPILAVEFDAEHMQILRGLNPRSSDDDHAREISEQMANAVTRSHFSSVRVAIAKLQGAGKTFCLIHSYRCSEIVLVPL